MAHIIHKQNNKTKGITICSKEHKISQYAGDTSLILDGSPTSLFASLDTLDFYANITWF